MKIGKRTYKLKYNLRALMVYEELAGETFKGGTLKSELLLYYSILFANNEDVELTFLEFTDALSENNFKLRQEFSGWLNAELEKFPPKADGDKKKA